MVDLLLSTGKLDVNRRTKLCNMPVSAIAMVTFCKFLYWVQGEKIAKVVRGFAQLSQGTPLHYAVHMGDVAIAMSLLRAGADPTVLDGDGARAYDIALRTRNGEMAELLSRAQDDWRG